MAPTADPAVLGPTVLLGSGRLGRQVAVSRSDRPVFIDTEGQVCCAHGERSATIQCWLNQERRALRMGDTELWIQPSGSIVCRHGNSRKVIKRMSKADDTVRFKGTGVIKCACSLSVPRRVGSVLVSAKAKRARAASAAETDAASDSA
jgi:hypothetical protein